MRKRIDRKEALKSNIRKPLFKDFFNFLEEKKAGSVEEFIRRIERKNYLVENYATIEAKEQPILKVTGTSLHYIGPPFLPQLLPLFQHFNAIMELDKSRIKTKDFYIDSDEKVIETFRKAAEKVGIKKSYVGKNKGHAYIVQLPLVGNASTGDNKLLLKIEGFIESYSHKKCIITGSRKITKHHILPYIVAKDLRTTLERRGFKRDSMERQALELYNYLLRVPLSKEAHNKRGWNVEKIVRAVFDNNSEVSVLDLYILLMNLKALENALFSFAVKELRKRGIYQEWGIYHNLSREKLYSTFLEELNKIPVNGLPNMFLKYA